MKMELILINEQNERLEYCWVACAEDAIALWRKVACVSNCMLVEFEVVSDSGEVVYRGNYLTDEC